MDNEPDPVRTPRPTGTDGSASDERAEQILAAACRAIVTRGFDSTRIADVAQEAGVSTGTVHYYFETKDDVLLAALRWANERPYRRLDEAVGQDRDATSRLVKLIVSTIPYPGQPREWWMLWIELWSRIQHRPDFRAAARDISARYRRYFRELIDGGAAAGEFHLRAPAGEVAERLVSLAEGLGSASVAGYRDLPPERMQELLLRFVAEQLGLACEELERRAAAIRTV